MAEYPCTPPTSKTIYWERKKQRVVAAILNRRLTASITFHDFLHGFWAGYGTGTTTLKDKLLHQLASMREEVLYMILLDLHKTYDALYNYRCLEILEGYGVGP